MSEFVVGPVGTIESFGNLDEFAKRFGNLGARGNELCVESRGQSGMESVSKSSIGPGTESILNGPKLRNKI